MNSGGSLNIKMEYTLGGAKPQMEYRANNLKNFQDQKNTEVVANFKLS